MTDEARPRTEAGRRLLERQGDYERWFPVDGRHDRMVDAILAIEAEAAIPDSRLRAAATELARAVVYGADPLLIDRLAGETLAMVDERWGRDIGPSWASRAALSPEGRQEPPDDAMYDDGAEPVR